MKKFYLIIFALLSSIALFAQVPDSLFQVFSYEKNIPFDLNVVSTFMFTNLNIPIEAIPQSSTRSGSYHVSCSLIRYTSLSTFTVSAWLTKPLTPDTTSLRPLIVFQHWGEGNKDEFLSEAIEMSKLGFVCLSIDAVYNCPDSPYKSLDGDAQPIFRIGIINVQRALDLATNQYNINPRCIFFVGHSYGAALGGILTGIEPRITGYVLMTGLYSFSKALMDESDTEMIAYRNTHPTEFASMVNKLKYFDADRYILYKSAPVFLQMAKNDAIIPLHRSRKYEQLITQPRKVRYYKSTHGLNKKARKDRSRFIIKLLSSALS